MKIYLVNRTVLGEEESFPRRSGDLDVLLKGIKGVEVTGLIDNADLIIAVLDRLEPGDVTMLCAQAQRGKLIWCFYPRGTVISPNISRAITDQISSAPDSISRAYPYDATANIPLWVRSSLCPGGMLSHLPA